MTFIVVTVPVMIGILLCLDFHYVYIFGQILVHEDLFDVVVVELDLMLAQVMVQFSVYFVFVHVVVIELRAFVIL